MKLRLTFLFLFSLNLVDSKCGDYTTCGTCAGVKQGLTSCLWCVDAGACVQTTQAGCGKADQIKYAYDCPQNPRPGYEYNETLARGLGIVAVAAANSDNEAQIQDCLSKVSTNVFKQYTKVCDSKGNTCSGFLAYSALENLIVMSMRGSRETDQFLEEGVDFVFNKLTTMPTVGGKVDSYFYDAWNAIFGMGMETDLKALVLTYPNAGLLCVGHSLGGSMASIAAAYSVKKGYFAPEKVRLITYGEPRTGDMTYAMNHDESVWHTYRLVNNLDPIPHMPAKFVDNLFDNPFHHRFEVWYQDGMQENAPYQLCQRADDDACSNSVGAKQNIADHQTYFERDLADWYKTGLPNEARTIERAFNSYHRSTCIRFQPRDQETDYLNIVKGYGCYSQVGRTGGKQEISLGRGCLFHEIIVHELMHSVGFWHEHSRADRDDHIRIVWENILPGMKSQFDKVAASLQDLQGEKYDYLSIMHYDSTAFSRNGKNTIETVEEGFTELIGSANDLSKNDIIKINKLYECEAPTQSRKAQKTVVKPPIRGRIRPKIDVVENGSEKCIDHFVDCPHFSQYCKRASFFFVMKSYCPFTCNHC
ncbi:unnamed protein product, partial [Mesorhabditis belari]|uniref:Metalloendopeptidase n=1 Tax=Mesorhabditis belari TaxID=2138241 RepID=A0AAF3ER50_9BILA